MSFLTDDANYIWHPYRQEKNNIPLLPIVKAQGSLLFDQNGKEYLDLVSSWWVINHGHCHPAIAEAIYKQAQTIDQILFSDATHSTATTLAKRLVQHLKMDEGRVFYSDNGSTAIEVALKMAYQYWFNQNQGHRKRFIGFEGAYHGDTFGAMATGKSSGFYTPFESFLFDVDMMPFPATFDDDNTIDEKEAKALAHLKNHLEKYGHETAALIIEPLVQGASGMRFCRPEFLQKVSALIKAYDILLILDEVMTGFYRTGTLFAHQQAHIQPDLICLAKGLTGGFIPLSVTVAQKKIYDAFLGDSFDKALAHGHSFAANPIGCAASLASLDLLELDSTKNQIEHMEKIHRDSMEQLLESPQLKGKLTNKRVRGTIAAIDIVSAEGYGSQQSRHLKQCFFEKGLFLRPLGPVLYLMPPFCTTEEQLIRAYDTIEEILCDNL